LVNRDRALPGDARNGMLGNENSCNLSGKWSALGGREPVSALFDLFVPLLLEAFGIRWFEEGSLSIEFCSFDELQDDDEVQPCIEVEEADFPDGDCDGGMTLKIWVNRQSGGGGESTLLAEGTAGVGNSRLTRTDSQVYKKLSNVNMQASGAEWGGIKAGEKTEAVRVLLQNPGDQISASYQRTLRDELKHILVQHDWYTEAKGGESPWGQAIMPPSVVYKMVHPFPFERQISDSTQIASFELRFFLGPLVLGVEYECSHEAVAITQGGAWVSSFLCDAESKDVVVEVVVEHRAHLAADQDGKQNGDAGRGARATRGKRASRL
jgi:hypothetical protein